MIQTLSFSWEDFRKHYAFLMEELLPALRGIDDVSIAVRCEMWAILPHWEEREFIFEYYGEEPQVYAQSDQKIQQLVTDVPWGEI